MTDDIETVREFLTARANLKSIGTRGMHVEACESLAALERVENQSDSLQTCALQAQEMAKEQMDRCIAAEAERDSLRAKLERAIPIIAAFVTKYPKWTHHELGEQDPMGAHALLSELSADAPAQPPQISDEAVERAWIRLATSSIPKVCTIDRDDLRAAIAAALEVMEKGK